MFEIDGWCFFYQSPALIMTQMPGGIKTHRAIQGFVTSIDDAKQLASRIIPAMIKNPDAYQLPYAVRQSILLTNQHDIDQ
jgi:hypothetical protein